MSASDGYVVGTTKIVDHGSDSVRWNLVILGDGYRATELAQYHTDVQNFVTALRTTPPLDELFCGINVHRVDIVSNESGADDPGCAGGTPTTANTYFDATFCSIFAGTPLDRLLTVDAALALSVASAQVPLRHQVLCIVNSSKYGGSGGMIATCSTHAQAAQIAIHEMGHSAFGLADEYGGNGAGTPAGEPSQPNVTRDTSRTTNKWRDLIAPGTPMPSQCDPGCAASVCVPPAMPPAAGAVGTYEGAIYSDCDTYRPLPSCYMRDYAPFCPVCAGVIRQTLQLFLPPESITLTTPSINFLNVPAGMGGVGVTTHRAILWEVVSCRSLTFEMTAGPTGGFGTPNGTSVAVASDPILPVTYARLWLSYTSTNPGDTASGNVTVRCVQTGESWVINIAANTTARPRSAVALVLDRSGSMNEDAGDGISKVQKLREAANVFISAMQPADGIGLVRFNEAAQRLMEIQEAGAAPGGTGRTIALEHIAGSDIDPAGATSIGDGVVNGKQMLDDAQATAGTPYDVTAMVVLTDGMWNRPPPLADVMGSITANTYAVGLGLPSNISIPALATLCQVHNGYLLVTGALSGDQPMRLGKYFLQILAGVSNAQITADPRGILSRESEHRIPVSICEADYGMDLIVLSPFPRAIDFQLEAPDGSSITPASPPGSTNSRFILSPYASYYRCALPVLPAQSAGSHAGQWHAILKLQGGTSVSAAQHAALPYEFVAHIYSSLTFTTYVRQASFKVDTIIHLIAALYEYDAPLQGNARVWGEIVRPDGVAELIPLSRDPQGQFTAAYPLKVQGVFHIRVRARGETARGTPFERERTLTAVATPGGNVWNPNEPKANDFCNLLHCLQEKDVISEELIHRLKEQGIDVPTLLKCLDERCGAWIKPE
ncbi:von Willebrand factor type A domain-containing protein [Nitrosospira multiformis ATCC 25196]|uniref:von Willebrand factor type A domain-containing protein n=1 Tax=Nitrosospira multiformis (strain ATCC 25196 / NCIMB 11849 / C 71) TaxID=323848 RepID=Q2Y9P6_NITMU|nr:M64 family metallopeptidase [Nitrosospira multiformis]ABB74525.1 von Willebrand factor, type A [Nitrosospira multiformis ATCC 25196]SEF88903.1 von Willebrand factor type A domain-containing protein [Nitrosospira multiformis ATCC 25196]